MLWGHLFIFALFYGKNEKRESDKLISIWGVGQSGNNGPLTAFSRLLMGHFNCVQGRPNP